MANETINDLPSKSGALDGTEKIEIDDGSSKSVTAQQIADLATTGSMTNPMTAVDDIIVGGTVTGGVASPARKAKGADGSALGVISGVLGYFATAFIGVVNAFTKNQSVSPVSLTYAATVTPDASLSNNFALILTGNLTLAVPTNSTAGMVLNFCLDQDSTGGRSITLAAGYHAVGTAPTFAITANAKNFISAYYDGSIWRYSGGAVS